jgi:predicted nucleic acid-binding protein
MAIVLFDTNRCAAGKDRHQNRPMNDDIMLRATEIRRASLARPPKISLPDCVIRATAEASGRIVVTRNPADFGGIGQMVRVPYEIVNGTAVNIVPAPQ